MTDRLDRLRAAIRRPLPLAYHPLYRFYEGGSLTRQFRGLPDRPDDWWSEDWVGSCTAAGNCDPDGRAQGMSSVELPGLRTMALREIVEALPEEMVGAGFAERWGPITGVLVKLLSPAGPVPLHAHPNRDWARRHLGSRFGKTEAWILLDTPGDGTEPAHAGIGFVPGIERDWFAGAVRRHDNRAIRGSLHRTDVHPGEVYVAQADVPHYLGPRVSFIEVQEPSDHIVIPETSGDDDAGATMGLGWDVALDMIDYTGTDAEQAFGSARQQPRVLRTSQGSREIRQSAAAVRAGSTVGIFVEVDTGMNRCGVDTAAEALALARHVSALPGLRFEGITGYEGHCTLTPEEDLRHEKQQQAMKLFTGVADLLEANGIACPIRSAGGIATWHWTAAYPGITEIQAGSYVVMDNFHGRMVPGFEHSLTIQASVISRQSKQVIVDVGNKSVADPFNVTIVGHDLKVFRSDGEHGISPRQTARRCGWATASRSCPGTRRARSTATTPSTSCRTMTSSISGRSSRAAPATTGSPPVRRGRRRPPKVRYSLFWGGRAE